MIKNNKVILAHILRRIKRNANAMILVIGDVGSGKTYFSLDFADTLSHLLGCEAFNDGWVCFSAKGFHQAIRREHKAGQPILADEFGTFMSARMSATKANRAISFILQTCRFYNHILIFTVPKKSFIDKHARKLFHYIVECSPRFKNNKNWVNFSAVKEVEYFKYGQYVSRLLKAPITYKDKETQEIKTAGYYETMIPRRDLIKEYEKKRKAYIDSLYEEQGRNLGITEKTEEQPKTKICAICGAINEISSDEDNVCRCGANIKLHTPK